MKIGNLDLMILNAVSGIMFIIVLVFFMSRQELAFAWLFLSLSFLVMGFLKEGFMITKTGYQPQVSPNELQKVYRIGLSILFFLNIIVFLIYWLPLPSPGPDALFWDAVTALLVFGGVPMVVLYFDFENLGKSLARNKYGDSVLS